MNLKQLRAADLACLAGFKLSRGKPMFAKRANALVAIITLVMITIPEREIAAADPAPAFAVEAPVAVPVASTAGPGQRVFWKTLPGQRYQLQTTTDLDPQKASWTTVAQVLADGPLGWADDVTAAGDMLRYYRVLMLSPTNDLAPPVLTAPQATQPPLAPAPSVSVLTVTATDNVRVTSVDFLNGDNLIGPALRGSGNNWSLNWTLADASALLSGRYYVRARAFDAAGNVGYSPALQFDVAGTNQNCVSFGGVTICADAAILAAGVYTFSGNIRINGLRLGSGATLTASSSQITGTGAVIVPGLDTVLSGSFDVDPHTGWLTIHPGTTATFPAGGIALSSQVNFMPTGLSVNIFSNAFSGAGSVTVPLGNQPFGLAVLAGSFDYSPGTAILRASGSMVLSNLLTASGTTELNLNDGSFSLMGTVHFQSVNNGAYSLNNALVQLTFNNPAVPALYVSGDLGISEGLSLTIRGNVLLNGQVELTGTGRGTIGGFNFDPLEVTLSRAAGFSSITTAQFAGKLLNPSFSGYLLSGTILSTGDLDINGTGTVSFEGFVFNPLNVHLIRNASTTNQVVANLSGTLRLSYIKPVSFTGVLRQDGSVDLSGQSGPYTVATFGGTVPRLDDASLTFDEQVFVGSFHLGGRDVAIQTLVNFHFTRQTDAAGGNSSLGVTAVTTQPTNPTLTLTGTAASTGACSLSGSLVNQQFHLWGYSVNSLGCGVARNAQGTVTFNITSGTLSYGPLSGSSSKASGTISSDGSGSVGFSYNSCMLGGYALQNVSLLLTQSASGTKTLQLAAGSMILPGFASEIVALTGSLSNDGSFNLTGTTSDVLTLKGLAVTSLARGATVTLTQNGLTVTGALSGGVLSQVATGSGSAVGTIALAPDGSASLSGCVTLLPLTFGQFQIRSTAADGSFSACFSPSGLTVGQNTVRITYNGVPLTTPSLPLFTISVNDSFSISVSAAMTAGLTLNSYSLPNATFTFNVSAGVATAQNFNASLSIPGFNPGFSSTSSSSVTGSLSSNGSFSLAGTSTSAQSLTGLAVTTLANGSTVSLTQTGLTITGTVSGGVLSQVVTGSGSAVGTLAVAPNGSGTLSGCITLSPLTFGQFQIRSTAADGTFSACFSPTGLTVGKNTVRITYNGSPLTTPSLPSFTMSLNDSFSVAVNASMTAGLTLNSYSLPNASFTFNVSAGAATVQNFSASLSVPGFNPGFSSTSSSSITGSLSSDGSFNLTGTTASAQTLSGLAVTTLANGSTISLTQNGLSISGTVSGGVLSQVVTASGSAVGTLAVAPNGSASLSGCITLSPLTSGQFQIRSTASDGSFSACFAANGLTVGQNTVRITYNGAPLTTPSLPSFTMSLNDSFSVAVNASMTAGLTLNSYSLPNASFTFNVSAGAATVQNFSASLSVPGFNPGFSSTSSSSITGSLSSSGSFNLTGTTASAQTLSGLAVTTLANGSTISLTQNGLSISGTVSGGVLSQVVTGSGSAVGTLAVAPNGSGTLSGCITLSPLTFGQFQIRSTAADGSFSACFSPSGLTVGQNTVRITYNAVPLTTPSLPSFTISTSGGLSISVTASMTAGMTLNGFGLSNASFLFSVSAGVATAGKFGATLNIPSSPSGFSKGAVAQKVSGSLNGDATFAISGTLSATEALSTSLPVGNVSAGASVVLTQAGLTITGSFTGGVITQVPLVSTSITLNVAADGSISLSGTVVTSSLTDHQISIGPLSGSTLSWNINNNGLTMPSLAAQVNVSGALGSAVTLPGFTMSASGGFSVSISSSKSRIISLSLAGYALTDVSFTLTRNAGVLSLSNFGGNLNIPGFAQRLAGTIDDLATLTLDYGGALTLGGFIAGTDGHLALRNSGLTAGGTLNISVNGTGLGSMVVTVNVTPSGTYSGSASTSLSIGGYTTSSFSATVSNNGLSGAPKLNYGNLTISLPNLSVTTTGVSGGGSAQRDSGWVRFFDVPGEVGDIYGRLQGTVSVSLSGSGTVDGELSATFGWWVVTLNHCNPPPPFGDAACFYNYGPDPIPSDHAIGASGGIASNGQFCVNQSICNPFSNCQNQFCFTLW
jgi:hypothetical protein